MICFFFRVGSGSDDEGSPSFLVFRLILRVLGWVFVRSGRAS